MRKEEYLNELSRHIRALSSTEVKEILADYEEHFTSGKAAGKTPEAIAQSLGAPRTVAQEILLNNLVSKAESSITIWKSSEVVMRMLFLFLILAPFNFLILLCPFLALFGLLVAGWCIPLVVLAIAVAVVALIIKSLSLLGAVGLFTGLSLLSMWVGTLGLAVLLGIVMLLLTKGLMNLVVAYVKWNINFITAKKA